MLRTIWFDWISRVMLGGYSSAKPNSSFVYVNHDVVVRVTVAVVDILVGVGVIEGMGV